MMPNFDTGHLFLTFLTPIRQGAPAANGETGRSYEQRLRMALARMPTALQSPATIERGENSPFARNRRNHLCRMFVLEDAVFNGRSPQNPIVLSIRKQDPIHPGHVDKLNSAWLVFATDIDAVTRDGDDLPETLGAADQARVRDAYAQELWATMEPELRDIYENCEGFDRVQSGKDFAAYLARCQVETTMPFNDYWITPPPIRPLAVKPMIVAAAIPAVVVALALLTMLAGFAAFWLHRILGWRFAGALSDWITAHRPGTVLVVGLIALAAVLWWLHRLTIARGQEALPPATHGDLPSILKALYLQQHFADFAVDHQGATPDQLHHAFGQFLTDHHPENRLVPTQPPGVLSVRSEGSTT